MPLATAAPPRRAKHSKSVAFSDTVRFLCDICDDVTLLRISKEGARMRRRSGVAAAAMLVTLGACAVDQPPVDEPPVQSTSTQTVGTGSSCVEMVCGSNSPQIDVVGFHELSLVGQAEKHGLALDIVNGRAQIITATGSYDLRVRNAFITGERNGVTMVSGAALIGARIPLHRGMQHFAIVIRGARTMNYFVGVPAALGAYTLEWQTESRGEQSPPLCNNIKGLVDIITNDQDDKGRFELMGMTTIETVVFEGDRVDEVGKRMSRVADDRWINIGCAGHTLSKLLLTHNTIHSQTLGLPRAWEQRQATLKLLVADYCNTGDAFTVAGQKLVWQGDSVMFFKPPPYLLEARWTEAGAACLNAPRMLFPSTLEGATNFPDIWSEINAVCKPNMCADITVNPNGADRVSANK
jgi:hypothetical protein